MVSCNPALIRPDEEIIGMEVVMTWIVGGAVMVILGVGILLGWW
jgi:hypothetical protein